MSVKTVQATVNGQTVIGTQRANGNGRYHINPDNVTII